MSMVSVTVHDATGNKKQQVDVPDDATVERLIAVLVERMRFPQNGPDGQLLSYKLQHRTSGRQLLDGQTLADANVKTGDILRLMPEITAGADSVRDDANADNSAYAGEQKTAHPTAVTSNADFIFQLFLRVRASRSSRLRV